MSLSRRARRWGAVALGALLALGATEGLLRATRLGGYAPRIDSYDFVLLSERPPLWGFDPSIVPWHQWDGDPWNRLPPGERLNYDINAAGLRGPPPPAGRADVLVMGDSFTFAEGVPYEESFCARIGEMLPAPGMPPARVVNGGVPGYGTLEELLRLPRLMEQFGPHVVLVVFVPNDPIDVLDARERESDLLAVRERPGPLRTLDVLRRALSAERRTTETEQWYLSHYFGEHSDEWVSAQGRLVAMRDLAASNGAQFGVAYFPLLHRLGSSPLRRIQDEVRQACGTAKIPYVDLTPALTALPTRDLWLHPTDHHPNRRAHAAVAEVLAPFVSGMLAE